MEKLSTGLKRKVFLNLLMALAALAICLVTAVISLTPQTYDVRQGEISPETITAPEDFIDVEATERLRGEARAGVADIYKPDQELSQGMLKGISDGFTAFENARMVAEQMYDRREANTQKAVEDEIAAAEQRNKGIQAQIDADQRARAQAEAQRTAEPEGGGTPTAAPTETPEPEPAATPMPVPTPYAAVELDAHAVDWRELLTESELATLRDMLPAYMDDDDLLTVLSMTEEELANLLNAATKAVQEELYAGVEEAWVQSAIESRSSEIARQLRLSLAQENMLYKALENNIAPNMVYDEEATAAERENAASLVLDVEYKKGQNIVLKGNVVTGEQYEVLRDLGLLASEITSVQPYYAIGIYIVFVFFLYAIFLAIFNRRLMTDTRKAAILCILTVVSYVVTVIAQLININIDPIFLFVILGAILLSPKNAIVYGVFLSLLLVSVTTAQQEFISRESLVTLLAMLCGSFFAVYMLKDMRYRSRLLAAGIVAAVPGVIFTVILWLSNIYNVQQALASAAIIAASGVLCGIVSIGVLPIIENLFKLITPTKLLELSGPNHPLIKRLMLEAPGTYHHSMLVANLAEAGCDAVGGFALLARVGAYYHDVGKIENPMFFKENQMNNFNPHDNFSPRDSSAILKKHVTNGVEMLKKHNMPAEIIEIAAQHHGNSLTGYFYAKAVQGGGEVNIKDFRYGGEPPRTREGAIVMLADCVEAAVRSMDNPSKEEIEAMVQKLIKDRYDEGQLDNAPLNRRDLNQIAQAFINIFQGVYHQRIKYPEIKIHGADDEDNVI
jgi:putative nucleotidyltransferase with HDIG domain